MANHKSSTPVGASAPGVTVKSSTPAAGSPTGPLTPPAGLPSGSPPSLTSGPGNPGSGPSTGVKITGLDPQGKLPSPYAGGFEGKAEQMLSGVQSQLLPGTSYSFNGTTWSFDQIVQVFQTVVSLYAALDIVKKQSKTALTQARQALAVELPAARQFYAGLVACLRAQFGKGNPVLSTFGIGTGAQKKPSSATKAAAAATAKLTRKARGTLGKKQKLQVKGGKATVTATGPDGQVVGGSSPAPAGSGPASPSGGTGGK